MMVPSISSLLSSAARVHVPPDLGNALQRVIGFVRVCRTRAGLGRGQGQLWSPVSRDLGGRLAPRRKCRGSHLLNVAADALPHFRGRLRCRAFPAPPRQSMSHHLGDRGWSMTPRRSPDWRRSGDGGPAANCRPLRARGSGLSRFFRKRRAGAGFTLLMRAILAEHFANGAALLSPVAAPSWRRGDAIASPSRLHRGCPYGPMHPWCFAYAFRSGPCRAENLDRRSHAADRPSAAAPRRGEWNRNSERPAAAAMGRARRSIDGRGYRRRRTTGTQPGKDESSFNKKAHQRSKGERPESVPAIEFSFEGRPVRSVVKDGQTWFVAADVCAVLEHPTRETGDLPARRRRKGGRSMWTPLAARRR